MTATSIALCRVSTVKQGIEGNSLEAQDKRVREAADYLGAPVEKFWRLSVSSRKGKNYKRPDLVQMLAYAKQNRRVKYIIVDEVDRFMRSIDEFYHWKLLFREEAGARLVYAAKPALAFKEDTYAAFEEMIDVFKAEASNQERITKTTEKMQARVMAGYYPGAPKQAYQKSATPGLHEPKQPQWSLLQVAFKEVLSQEYTPREALVRLNAKGYRQGSNTDIDMERFKRILLDPYYAGIVQMSNWPTNPNGLHRAMITPYEHDRIKEIVSGKKKFSRQQFNEHYRLSNLMECTECIVDETAKYPRLVGYNHHNGKQGDKRKFYEKYRCRACKKEHNRKLVHDGLNDILRPLQLVPEKQSEFIRALRQVWEQEHKDNAHHVEMLHNRLNKLATSKSNLVIAMGDGNISKEDGDSAIEVLKADIKVVEDELDNAQNIEQDFVEFVDFTMNMIRNMQDEFWKLDQKHLGWCKQLLFPEGFSVSRSGKVYTPKISDFYRLATIEKDSEEPSISYMVIPRGVEPLIFRMRT